MIKRFESLALDSKYYDETILICNLIKKYFSKISTAIWIYPAEISLGNNYINDADKSYHVIYNYFEKYDFAKSNSNINEYMYSDEYDKILSHINEENLLIFSYLFEVYNNEFDNKYKLLSYIGDDDVENYNSYDRNYYFSKVTNEFYEEIEKLGYVFFSTRHGYIIFKDEKN